jgi:hypothetical protein
MRMRGGGQEIPARRIICKVAYGVFCAKEQCDGKKERE